jgi:hypothetical protein
MMVITWVVHAIKRATSVSATQIRPCAALIFDACATLSPYYPCSLSNSIYTLNIRFTPACDTKALVLSHLHVIV